MAPATWIDLLDPSAEELRAKAPKELEDTALAQLLRARVDEVDPIRSHPAAIRRCGR